MGTHSQRSIKLKSGDLLTLRTATPADAQSIIDYVLQVSSESGYLLLGLMIWDDT